MSYQKAKKMVQGWPEEHTGFKEFISASKFPRLQSNLWDVLDKHVRSIQGPISVCTELNGSVDRHHSAATGGLLVSMPG